jgi:valine--pyruvate aminotransferase
MSAIAGLSNPNIGQQITLPLIQSGEILRLSREVVRPFYQKKCELARQAAIEIFGDDIEFRVCRFLLKNSTNV